MVEGDSKPINRKKKVIHMFSKTKLLIYIVVLTVPLLSCDDNSMGNEPDMDEDPATLTVEDQGTSNGNTVTIPEAKVSEGAWVVIHRTSESGDGPMVPDIIGKAAL